MYEMAGRTLPANIQRIPLPSGKEVAYWQRHLHRFRRAVEQAVLDQHGKVSVVQASRIATACTAYRQAARVERLLAHVGQPGEPGCPLSHEQWLGYSDRVLRYRECADRALAALGLDAGERRDVWAELYATKPVSP